MLVTVDAPYVDTAACDLSHQLGGPLRPALHVLDLPLVDPRPGPPSGAGAPVRQAAGGPAPSTAPWALRLRLLGASHQVVVDAPAGRLVETVACLPGRRAALPAAAEDAGTGYRFTARVLRLAPRTLRDQVADLRRELADDERALVGVFPGDPEALTALHAVAARADAPGGSAEIAWRTWHAYPQTGELVQTATTITVRCATGWPGQG